MSIALFIFSCYVKQRKPSVEMPRPGHVRNQHRAHICSQKIIRSICLICIRFLYRQRLLPRSQRNTDAGGNQSGPIPIAATSRKTAGPQPADNCALDALTMTLDLISRELDSLRPTPLDCVRQTVRIGPSSNRLIADRYRHGFLALTKSRPEPQSPKPL